MKARAEYGTNAQTVVYNSVQYRGLYRCFIAAAERASIKFLHFRMAWLSSLSVEAKQDGKPLKMGFKQCGTSHQMQRLRYTRQKNVIKKHSRFHAPPL